MQQFKTRLPTVATVVTWIESMLQGILVDPINGNEVMPVTAKWPARIDMQDCDPLWGFGKVVELRRLVKQWQSYLFLTEPICSDRFWGVEGMTWCSR